MAIYTRFGEEVDLLTARLVPVWIEHTPNEIKWHYKEPKKIGKQSRVKVLPIWHVTAKCVDDGRFVCDGKLVNSADFRADEGSCEIRMKMHELNPDHSAKDNLWNKAGGPEVLELFEPAKLDMVA